MVDEAADGADAWAQISIHDYDYVILDLHMPKLNGLELLRLMRKLSKPPRSIMLTGDKSEYVEQESRTVRHILISPFRTLAAGTVSSTASQGEWEEARSEAEKVRNDIQNGADFITQVEKYSDDDATNENGGKLGAVIRGQMVPAFEEAVFSMQKGDLSEPVKTQYGYHLIQVTDITPKKQLAYNQVKENIRTALLEQKQTQTWEKWLAKKQAELGVSYREGYAPSSAVGLQQAPDEVPELKPTTTTGG